MIPEEYKKQASALPGVDAAAFLASLEEPPAVSVKLNLRKCRDAAELGYGDLQSVKWCPSGYYLPERPLFTLNPLLHAGVFYVQDASSMIYEHIIRYIMGSSGGVGTSPDFVPMVADLCAAPGGKTTSMINALPDGALVLANEFMTARAAALRENLLKWGYRDILVTNSDTRRLADAASGVFDIVAVDAPCSGEGMMRKEEMAAHQWSPGLVTSCAAMQRTILADAVEMLAPGGWLIYSTCTFNLDENERQLAWLASGSGLEGVEIPVPPEWGIGRQLEGDMPALRFMPHLTRGEGLFVALLRKPSRGGGNRTPGVRIFDALKGKVRVLADGIPMVKAKGKVVTPASELVLATDYNKDMHALVDLDTDSALAYLRHEALRLDPDAPKGIVAVAYQGHPLGLVKNIGTRANNMYPPEWKIRMQIPR